jgi:putative heme iron utilization protein
VEAIVIAHGKGKREVRIERQGFDAVSLSTGETVMLTNESNSTRAYKNEDNMSVYVLHTVRTGSSLPPFRPSTMPAWIADPQMKLSPR